LVGLLRPLYILSPSSDPSSLLLSPFSHESAINKEKENYSEDQKINKIITPMIDCCLMSDCPPSASTVDSYDNAYNRKPTSASRAAQITSQTDDFFDS
jgi:hypothetical protein